MFGFAQVNLALNLQPKQKPSFNPIRLLLRALACSRRPTSFLLARIQCSLISLRFFSCSLCR